MDEMGGTKQRLERSEAIERLERLERVFIESRAYSSASQETHQSQVENSETLAFVFAFSKLILILRPYSFLNLSFILSFYPFMILSSTNSGRSIDLQKRTWHLEPAHGGNCIA